MIGFFYGFFPAFFLHIYNIFTYFVGAKLVL